MDALPHIGSLTLRAINILVLLAMAAFFHFRKSGSPSTDDAFFNQQRWNVTIITACLIAFYLIPLPFDMAQHFVSAHALKPIFEVLPVLVMLLALWRLFCHFHHSFGTVGITRTHAAALILTGLQWILSIEIAIHLFQLVFSIHILDEHATSTAPLPQLIEQYGTTWGHALFSMSLILLVLYSVIEEVLFRGLLYGTLRKQIRAWPAIAVSSFFFMLGHELVGLRAFILGCVLAYLYERFRSLVPGMVVHIIWNLTIVAYAWTGVAQSIEPQFYDLFIITVSLAGLLGVQILSRVNKIEPPLRGQL